MIDKQILEEAKYNLEKHGILNRYVSLDGKEYIEAAGEYGNPNKEGFLDIDNCIDIAISNDLEKIADSGLNPILFDKFDTFFLAYEDVSTNHMIFEDIYNDTEYSEKITDHAIEKLRAAYNELKQEQIAEQWMYVINEAMFFGEYLSLRGMSLLELKKTNILLKREKELKKFMRDEEIAEFYKYCTVRCQYIVFLMPSWSKKRITEALTEAIMLVTNHLIQITNGNMDLETYFQPFYIPKELGGTNNE